MLIENSNIALLQTAKPTLDVLLSYENIAENEMFLTLYSKAHHEGVIDDPNQIHITIFDKANQRAVGSIFLRGIQNEHDAIEFRRFVIYEKGKNFGREALALSKKYCFEQLGCHRFWLETYEENTAARKLYQSEGLMLEGVRRETIKQGEQYRSLVLYAILKKEYFCECATNK
jgi:diamine N-acetyltransferase